MVNVYAKIFTTLQTTIAPFVTLWAFAKNAHLQVSASSVTPMRNGRRHQSMEHVSVKIFISPQITRAYLVIRLAYATNAHHKKTA
jgi:hypothetical protein